MRNNDRTSATTTQVDLALDFDQLAAAVGNREHTDIACPACGPDRRHAVNRRRGVLRIWRRDPDFITYCCARCGARGWAKRGDRNRSVFEPFSRKPTRATPLKTEMLAAAEHIWRDSVAITGTPGTAYLAARGIDLDAVPDHGGLRFHPRCPWSADTTAPCIIARFTDAITGIPLGIRRRRIDAKNTPLSLGPTGGGVIRLSPDDEVTTGLVIGEGLETVLAAMTRIEHRGTQLRPAWACGSAGAMRTFPVLAGIEALTILVDADHLDCRRGVYPGQDAARGCAERWAAAYREVTLLTPRDLGVDFNDLVRGLPP
jgi:hypothetical protein